MFTDVGFHLKSGFKKILCSQMLVYTLILVSRKFCVHQFFLYNILFCADHRTINTARLPYCPLPRQSISAHFYGTHIFLRERKGSKKNEDVYFFTKKKGVNPKVYIFKSVYKVK